MAILIDMPMPTECRGCPMEMYYFNTGETRCRASGKMLAYPYQTIQFEGRPDWCPLREVVRCKDCKYWVPDQVGVVEQPYCTRLGRGDELIGLDLRIGSADHFCCFGEKKEDE